jgi:hypothetical protein
MQPVHFNARKAMATMFSPGDMVKFSALGREKVRSMPEAWGLHRALYGEEVGEVVETFPAEEDTPEQVSVEFPSGGAHLWAAACFERAA